MENTKNTTTQAAALRWLIDNAPAGTPEDVMTAAENLYTAKTKKYDRPRTESKAARLNATLVDPVVALVGAHPEELVNATFIRDNLNHFEVRSAQKARVIADMAIAEGKLDKYTKGGRVYYCLPGQAPATE